MYEENIVADAYIESYIRGGITFGQALDALHEQFHLLRAQHTSLQMGGIKLFVIAERERERHSGTTIALKNIGFISGSLQFIGGMGTCFSSLKAACQKYGVPLMVNGAENTWENGYYLLYHEDPRFIPVRQAYRSIAKFLGGEDKWGDIAFSSVDIGLSLGSMSSLIPRPDAWRLFHSIRDDFFRSWRSMGAAGLGAEAVGNASSGFSIYRLLNSNETSWSELKE